MIYNTFPMMGDRWIPSDIWNESGLANLTENPATAQFNHRLLAYATLTGITGCYLGIRGRGGIPPNVKRAAGILLAAGWGQAALGVLTLWHSVPVALGSMHQTGAMITYTSALYLVSLLRP